MKYKFEDITLSGKGFVSTGEFLDENMKIKTNGVHFYQVMLGEEPLGWLVNGEINLLADITAHSKEGMQGRSIDEKLEYALIIDRTKRLGDFVGELQELPIEDMLPILEKYKDTKHLGRGNIDVGGNDDDDILVILSTKSDIIFVQSDKDTIMISKGEVLVLNRTKEKLTHVSSKDGIISIGGDKSLQIGHGKIIIDGEEFDPQNVVEKAMKGISKAFSKSFVF
ncbi:MAG: hypothetical protein INQ03_12900 [Candidatus Heimdallarchaeota archaeon]|nr:hypothetical protein [Candidatus Heimdallarchaeota archaeon]